MYVARGIYIAAEEGNLAKLNEAVGTGADIEYRRPRELVDDGSMRP